MNRNKKSEPLNEDTDIEENQNQSLDRIPKISVITSKKRWPKRGGCSGLNDIIGPPPPFENEASSIDNIPKDKVLTTDNVRRAHSEDPDALAYNYVLGKKAAIDIPGNNIILKGMV